MKSASHSSKRLDVVVALVLLWAGVNSISAKQALGSVLDSSLCTAEAFAGDGVSQSNASNDHVDASSNGFVGRDDGYGIRPDGTTGEIITPVPVSAHANASASASPQSFKVKAEASVDASIDGGVFADAKATLAWQDVVTVEGPIDGNGHWVCTMFGYNTGNAHADMSLTFNYFDPFSRFLDSFTTSGTNSQSGASLTAFTRPTPNIHPGDQIQIKVNLSAEAAADFFHPSDSADFSHTFFIQFVSDTPGLSIIDSDGEDFSEAYVVPEPTAISLLAIGGLGFLSRRRRSL